MFTVRGTEKIRAILDLPLLKQQIVKNEPKVLSDSQYWSADVQTAVQLGYLRVEVGDLQAPSNSSDRTVKCKVIHRRSVTINALGRAVKPGHLFYLTESQIKSDEIQQSISAGMIKILGIVGPEEEKESEEGYVSLQGKEVEDKTKKKNVPRLHDQDNSRSEGRLKVSDKLKLPEPLPPTLETKMPELETNVEMQVPRRVIEDENPDPVTPAELNDPKKKSVVWNPGKSPLVNEMQKVNEEAPVDKKEEKDPRKNSLVWDFVKNKARLIQPQNTVAPEVKFADEEQEEKRIQSHPKLKDKPVEKPPDITFVDDKYETERIQKHPILKNKPVE